MSKRKAPIKGLPNFYHFTDEQVRNSFDLIEQLLFVYKDVDSDVCGALKTVWKDLSSEKADRVVKSPEAPAPLSSSVRMIKPKVVISPLKRKRD